MAPVIRQNLVDKHMMDISWRFEFGLQPAKHFIMTLSVALPARKNSLKDASVSTKALLIKTLLLGNSAESITSRHMIFC